MRAADSRREAIHILLSRRAKTLTHIEPMPSTSLNCFTPLLAVLLLGGVSPAAGQNNVFANRTALLVARDAWCADPTAAAAIYGPIALWDISQVTDLSYVASAAKERSHGSSRVPFAERVCTPDVPDE